MWYENIQCRQRPSSPTQWKRGQHGVGRISYFVEELHIRISAFQQKTVTEVAPVTSKPLSSLHHNLPVHLRPVEVEFWFLVKVLGLCSARERSLPGRWISAEGRCASHPLASRGSGLSDNGSRPLHAEHITVSSLRRASHGTRKHTHVPHLQTSAHPGSRQAACRRIGCKVWWCWAWSYMVGNVWLAWVCVIVIVDRLCSLCG